MSLVEEAKYSTESFWMTHNPFKAWKEYVYQDFDYLMDSKNDFSDRDLKRELRNGWIRSAALTPLMVVGALGVSGAISTINGDPSMAAAYVPLGYYAHREYMREGLKKVGSFVRRRGVNSEDIGDGTTLVELFDVALQRGKMKNISTDTQV